MLAAIPLTGFELEFLVKLMLSVIAGFLIGAERESRGKDAGISTHSFVIGGSMIFTMLSVIMDAGSPARIAAQIVSGVGFLGAGIIMKEESGHITNLTTAAAIWFSASIGMAIGFGWYLIAMIATVYGLVVPRIPHITRTKDHHDK